MLDRLLNQLTEEFSLPAIESKGAHKELILTPGTPLSLHAHDPGFTITAPLGACPAQNKEELFTQLMRANFLGQGTNGSVISMDEQEKCLTLFQLVPYDLNYKAFKHAIEDFVNFATYWKEIVDSYQKG